MKKILLGLFLLFSGLSYGQTSNDADAEAFITACDADPAGKLTYIQKVYITQLVEGLKSIGVWSKCKAIYPFVGGTEFKHKFNLKDPRDLDAAFRLTFPNGMTHSSLGIQGNGTNQYANTFMSVTPSMYNSGHLSVYSTTNQQLNDSRDMGANNTTLNFQLCAIRSFNGQGFASIGSPTVFAGSGITNYNAKGIYIANRNSSTSMSFWRQGVKLSERTESFTYTSGATTNPIIIGGTTNGASFVTFSNRAYGIATIGDGLTDTEAIQLSHLITYSQTTLQRQ